MSRVLSILEQASISGDPKVWLDINDYPSGETYGSVYADHPPDRPAEGYSGGASMTVQS